MVIELQRQVAAAGYVEPLSTVHSKVVVDGRVCGVPAQPVAGADASRLPTKEEARCFRNKASAWAMGYWCLLLPKTMMPFLGLIFLRLHSGCPSFMSQHRPVLTDHTAQNYRGFVAIPSTRLSTLKNTRCTSSTQHLG